MPILDDIMDHDLLGPAIRQGREEGREQGREQGREEGLHEGELRLLRFQIQKRFGTIPACASQRLETFTSSELEQLALKLFNAETIEDLFA
jgi:flagellar biosynthesis/type III secretory pathway protein FliH